MGLLRRLKRAKMLKESNLTTMTKTRNVNRKGSTGVHTANLEKMNAK